MPQPSNATITIDGDKFDALTAHVEIATHHDDQGMPMMSSLKCGISAIIDMHDTENVSFGSLSKLYNLAQGLTRDKIKDIKIEYWTDENQTDAICTYSFRGWISLFSTSSGQGSNHTLRIHLQPELDAKQFIDMKMGN
ncbi:hypothetical protein [Granulicella arctica]|uniref:Uncharacterized protein n=1 Tax=Granulicella arctica TaxID=940613 RepID=A0A7Y9PH97_9BACT|nr:hypothetical protein [Granulicella arctica]NYF79113.1 hypothetical protein [Granulicella arctica]